MNQQIPGLERMGLAWDVDEIQKLLQSVRKKKTIEEIAKEHQRTHGAISAKLRSLAYEYYEEEKSIDEIKIITGLSKDQIVDSIAKHEAQKALREKKKEKKLETMKSLNLISENKKLTEFQEFSTVGKENFNERILESLYRIEDLLQRVLDKE